MHTPALRPAACPAARVTAGSAAASAARRVARLAGRLLGIAGCLLLAWPVTGAAAVEDYRVTAPAGGQTLAGEFSISASVTASAVEEVDSVELRLLRGGTVYGRSGDLQFRSGEPSGGTSEWIAALNPRRAWIDEGRPMPNGAYRVQVRVHSSVQGVPQEPTEWTGHEIVLDVAPDPTVASVTVLSDDTRTAEISWVATDAPDFTRYLVERAPAGGAFAVIAEVAARDVTSVVDAAEDDGRYSYRVTVFRTGGRGGERGSEPSRAATVTYGSVEPPPTPSTAPTAPEGTPGPSPAPGQGDTGAGGSPSPSPSPSLGIRRGSGTIAVGSGEATPPGAPAPGSSPVAAPPAGANQAFAPTLDYGVVPTERTVQERRVVQVPGTGVAEDRTITVFNRQLDPHQVLPLVAGGLLLTVTAAHLRRFLHA